MQSRHLLSAVVACGAMAHALSADAAAPARQVSYVEPGPRVAVKRFADGARDTVATETVWRPMCGSAIGAVTPAGLRKIAQATREREAAHAALGAIQTAGANGTAQTSFDLVFVINSSLPEGAADAIAAVEAFIETQFSDPVTVRINLGFGDLGQGVLGATGSSFVQDSWPDVRAGLQAGADGDDDILAFLPEETTIPVRYDGNSDTVTDETRVYVTRANYVATIGEVAGTAASMTFNSAFSWDYTPPNISGGRYDFQSVLAHEVGHALGFVSGADFRNNDIETLDIFRFQLSDGGGTDYNPDTFEEFQTTARMVDQNAPGTNDDVISDLIAVEYRMSDGVPSQASHFRDQFPPIGVMDPTLGSGQTFYPDFYRQSDLDMFDAIGWDYPAQNTTCEQARDLLCNDAIGFDNTVIDAVPDPPIGCAGGAEPIGALWFRFVATDTSASLSTCDSRAPNSTFAVYDGECGALTEIACSDDDGCGGLGRLGDVCVTGLTPGNTYYVQFAAAGAADRGIYTLDVRCSCSGACCLAPPLNCLELQSVECGSAGGTFAGPDTRCLGDGNLDGLEDACGVSRPSISQLAGDGGHSAPSNLDDGDHPPAVTVADDFTADGRPISGVRWWGSALDASVAPEGWLIGFDHTIDTETSRRALGVYACPSQSVSAIATPIDSCDAPMVIGYSVDLSDCCLADATVDDRTGVVPAVDGVFFGEACLDYELAISAVVGTSFARDENGACVATATGGAADGPYWGWYSTDDDTSVRAALTGAIDRTNDEWRFGPWSPLDPSCGPTGMSFELLTTTPGAGEPEALWGNGPPSRQSALTSQFGGEIDDAITADDFELLAASVLSRVEWTNEEEPEFTWSGRVHLEVFADSGEASPDESGGPVATLWIPDEGGSVTRTPMGPGLFEDRFGYVVDGVSIPLDAGVWWIGVATIGADGTDGLAFWSTSHAAPFDEIFFMGQSHLRYPSIGLTSFTPWDELLPGVASYDMAFTLSAATMADCNCNGVPDEDDIDSLTSADCNANGTPDECEPDCDRNEAPDDCDLATGTAEDCQANGVPDVCDIAFGTERDEDGNGVPDVCECADNVAMSEADPVDRMRYIAFSPTGAGRQTAIRIRPLALEAPDPPNSPNSPSPDFSEFVGATMWVGPPGDYGSGDNAFTAAPVVCEPHCADFGAIDRLHVFGAEIVPSSDYELQVANCACGLQDESGFSDALTVTTGRWGDVVAPFGAPSGSAQPDFGDIAALVERFQNVAGAIDRTRAQLQPNVVRPEDAISFTDIAATVDAFTGLAYPYPGPCVCPPDVVCGATPCANDAACDGGRCVDEFCTDACGRCAAE